MGVAGNSAIELVLKQDRAVVVSALIAVIVSSWVYVLTGAGMGMSPFDMSSLSLALGQVNQMPMATSGGKDQENLSGAMAAMATPINWTADYAVLMFFMWWIMMMAMMLPSAAPIVLLHAAVDRNSKTRKGATPWRTAAFIAGYLVVWACFSATAVGLQWAFEGAGLLSPMMMNSTSALFAAAILLFAGLYQLTPIKQACLKHCRGPVQFMSRPWRGRRLFNGCPSWRVLPAMLMGADGDPVLRRYHEPLLEYWTCGDRAAGEADARRPAVERGHWRPVLSVGCIFPLFWFGLKTLGMHLG